MLINTAFPDISLFAPKTPNTDYFVENRQLKIFPILPRLSTNGFVLSASSRMRAVSNQFPRA